MKKKTRPARARVLQSLRRSRAIPALALTTLLLPLFPRTTFAQEAEPTTAINLSAQLGQSMAGATESSPAGVNGIASASVNPSTGVFQTSIPFSLPAARGDVQPALALSFNSAGAFGVGGRGWSLGIPSIERHNPSGPPQFANDPAPGAAINPATQDRFTYGGAPLVEICAIPAGGGCAGLPRTETMPSFATGGGWHYYRLATETGSMLRFFWSSNHQEWIVQSFSGEMAEYGAITGTDSTSIDRDALGNAYRWNLQRRYDTERIPGTSTPANPIEYVWTRIAPTGAGFGGTTLGYLTDIYDTPTPGLTSPTPTSFAHHTHLVYTQPAWTPSPKAPVWLAAPTQVLSRVDVTSQDLNAAGARQQVRRYYLTYTSFAAQTSDGPPAVQSVQLEGNCTGTSTPTNYETNGQLADPASSNACPRRPATTFTYAPTTFGGTPSVLAFTPQAGAMPSLAGSATAPMLLDADNDGLPDVIQTSGGSNGLGSVYINQEPTSQNFSAAQTLTLAEGESDLTQLSQIGPDPAFATGTFQMDGQVDLMWNSYHTWNSWLSTRTPALATCQVGAIDYYCDPAVSYNLLSLTRGSSGTWSFAAGQASSDVGRFFLGAEYPHFPQAIGDATFPGIAAVGAEMPVGSLDMNGDGIADLLTAIEWGTQNTGTEVAIEYWAQFSIRFSGRAFDNTYYPFSGYASSAPFPDKSLRTDVCIGGVSDPAYANDGPQVIQNDSSATFADVDGDGIADYVHFGIPMASIGNPEVSAIPLWWRGHGDGVFGVCPDGSLQCACSAAAGEILVPYNLPTLPGTPATSLHGAGLPTSPPLAMHDVTGDGLADLVAAEAGGFAVYVNEGTGMETFSAPIHVPANSLLKWNATATPTALYFADVNGSGVDDVIFQEVPTGGTTATAIGYIDLFAGGADGARALRPGLLTDINNGLGLTVHVTYDTSTALAAEATQAGSPWAKQSPQPLHVVTAVTTADSTGDSYKTTYSYRDPVFDGHDNRFLGFTTVQQTTPGDALAPAMNTRTTYFYGACGAQQGTACVVGADNPLASYRGLPMLTEVFDATGTTYLSTTHHSYATKELYAGADGRYVRRIYETQTDTYPYATAEGTNGASGSAILPALDFAPYTQDAVTLRGPAHHLQRKIALDGYGNIGTVTDNGDIGDLTGTTPDPVIVSSTTWQVLTGTDPANGWIWRPSSTFVGASPTDASGRSTSYSYDGYGNVTDVTIALSGTLPLQRASYGAPTPTGASQDGSVHVAHLTYDAQGLGNVATIQSYPSSTSGSATARCTEYFYDGAYAQLRTTERVDVGPCQAAQAIVTQHTFDRVLGVETSTLAPNSARSAFTYDGYGRVLTIAKPNAVTPNMTDGPTTTIEYPDTAYGQLVHTRQAAGGDYAQFDTYVYKDALGRTIQVASTSDTTGQWVVSGRVLRDSRGRTLLSFVPYFATSGDGSALYTATIPSVAKTQTTYDAFNRVTKTAAIDGTTTSQRTYYALSVTLLDGETSKTSGPHVGASVTKIRDGHGRPVETDVVGNGGTIATVAKYQATGEVTQITRSGSTPTGGAVSYSRTMQYDTMGRLVGNVEPNTTVPAALGDPAGHAWRYAYDDLGELVGTSDARTCGENIGYDGAGRIQWEDYSPCSTTLQGTWTQPTGLASNPMTGDGTEAFYVYEGGALASGQLSDVYDRASHLNVLHDARGRATTVTRTLAGQRAENLIANRYSASSFSALTTYDDRDRVATQTTGANVAALLGPSTAINKLQGQSTVVGMYSPRGILESVTSSYGQLVTGTVVEADGRPDTITYADPAKTTISYSYNDPRRRLTEAKIYRAGSFLSATGTYTPPAASTLQPTQQVLLADDAIAAVPTATAGYDGVDNPLQIVDQRTAGEWPAGAKPVTRAYTYDDSYRVTRVANTFAAGSDANVPPIAAKTTTQSPFPLATPTLRTANQTFAYDGLGNMIASGDGSPPTPDGGSVPTFYDRSLGVITNRVNQLQSATLVQGAQGTGGTLNATYDAAGNMVQLAIERDGSCTAGAAGAPCNQLLQYDWDEVGHLARARRFDLSGAKICSICAPSPLPNQYAYPSLPTTAASADVSYTYDAGGTRVLRASTPSGESTTYSAEIFPSLRLNHATFTANEYETTTDTEAVYLVLGGAVYGRVVYAPSAPMVNGNPLHIFLELTDPLSSVATVIDRDTSELVERTTFLAYGALDSDYRPDRWNDFREDYKFTGKEDDVEVGLTYFGARYYSPQLGRWMSPDPLAIHALQGDLNPYAYVHGRVATDVDPTGLDDALSELGELGTLGIGGVLGQAVDGAISELNGGLAPVYGGPSINGQSVDGLGGSISGEKSGNPTPSPSPSPSPTSTQGGTAGFGIQGVDGLWSLPLVPHVDLTAQQMADTKVDMRLANEDAAWMALIRSQQPLSSQQKLAIVKEQAGNAFANLAMIAVPLVRVEAVAAEEVGAVARSTADIPATMIGQESGPSIVVPEGATGPTPAWNGKGVQYTGGAGGPGLNARVTGVRIMDPTLPKGPSPGYPSGYGSYLNATGQVVDGATGRTLMPTDPGWHIPLQ